MEFYINKKVNKPYTCFGLIGGNILYFGLITFACIMILFITMAVGQNYFIVAGIALFWLWMYRRLLKINKKHGENGFMQQKSLSSLPNGIVNRRINNLVKINGKKN